ncbi:MAG: tRNA 2-thiouridine(34) synthase MnmA [Phycisphaerales bacterium]|nr:tRNA 2-thiouridine(34) synthase MnmA [Phycisphaerales bacterium]
MSRNGRVIVAMSGGVDSSVAACLLKDQGYDCVGVFLRVGVEAPEMAPTCAPSPSTAASAAGSALPVIGAPPRRNLKHGCCSATDAQDARAVAGRLGITFYALNFQKDFDSIIDYFVNEYRRARTPNPCAVCNIDVKFGRLLRYADAMDAEFIATGHYARIVRRDGVAHLARGVHSAKDQSYVLFGIQREALRRCLFPIGEIADKADVRAIAQRLGLDVFDKPDSQEICFVPDNDYKRLLRERAPEALRGGDVVDQSGVVLARHDGIGGFTIGQRRGLGFAAGRPLYVLRIEAETGRVVVGDRSGLDSPGLVADRVNWLSEPITSPRRVQIKIRHMHAPTPGEIEPLPSGTLRARFDVPQPAVTPGQVAAFYDADIVLAGGWIREAICE